MGILFNEVDRKDLRAGDHIYSWRTGYTYAHHGIFVGDDDEVHFTRGLDQELGAGVSLTYSFVSSSIPKQHLSCPRSPDSCGLQYGNSGVIRSCLDCFLEGGPVHRFEYGVSKAVFFAQVRGGTCNLFTVQFICINMVLETTICFVTTVRTLQYTAGQDTTICFVAAMDGVRSASRLAYMFSTSLGLALMVGTYFLKRYAADIGVRVDKTKVAVEDLARNLDCLGRNSFDKTKVPVEDSSLYPASSTGMSSVDKAKVRVEDVAVFLDSFTGKKLPLQDLAVDLDSSTGIRLDKTKVPVEDSAVNLESTGIRVDKMKAPVGSSTGKKSPAEDLAAYSDSSTAIFVDKSKVPVEGEDFFLDSSTFKKPSADESSTSQEIRIKRSSFNNREETVN